MKPEVLTIGHSSLDYESFLALLRKCGVGAIADVRSYPYSRNEAFDRETLKRELNAVGISYVFLGAELGGRPEKQEYYCDGVADYEKMATDDNFKSGLNRVIKGSDKYRIALMCSEHNPLDCHRCLLVGRALAEKGCLVKHILSDGSTMDQRDVEDQLLKAYGHGSEDMFVTGQARIADAYRERAMQVSYRKPHDPRRRAPIPKTEQAK